VSLVLGSRAPNPIEIGASRLQTTKSLREHGISPPQCVSACLSGDLLASENAQNGTWRVYTFRAS
jgi:hypothetical protein